MNDSKPIHLFNNASNLGSIISPVHGDVNVSSARLRYVLERIHSMQPPLDLDALGMQPSRLLNARYRIVPFTGRNRELETLKKWRETPGALRVLLLHAAGGHGKTRLALEFADSSARAGWHVWQARHGNDPTIVQSDSLVAPDDQRARHLILVDYADRWAHHALAELCGACARTPGKATRVLLVSRTIQGWWALRGELDALQADSTDLPLESLSVEVSRIELFHKAQSTFARALKISLSRARGAPASLSGESYASILSVHMAALAAVPLSQDDTVAPDEVDDVAAFLLAREMRNWEHLRVSGKDFHSGYRLMAKAVFIAILSGPHPDYRDAKSALTKADIKDNTDQLLTDHRACYPPADPGHSLEPLYPDRLAEDFLGLLTPGHGITGFDVQPWAATAPAELLTREPSGNASPHTARALTFLASAAARWPHLTGKLSKLLRSDPELATIAGGAALHAIAELSGLDSSVLDRISEYFPTGHGPDLDTGMCAITDAIVQRRLPQTHEPMARALLFIERAKRMGQVGQYQKSLDDYDAAVSILRQLAATNPGQIPLRLVEARVNQSQVLHALGRLADALHSVGQAEKLLRKAHAHTSNEWVGMLISTLTAKAAILQTTGEPARSRVALDEAESLLITSHTGTSWLKLHQRSDIALMLGHIFRQNGDTPRALSLLRAAYLQHRQDLSADDVHGAAVYGALLNNYGAIAVEAGMPHEATTPLTEAVEIYEKLSSTNPGLFADRLDLAKMNLAAHLASLTEDVLTDANAPNHGHTTNDVSINLFGQSNVLETIENIRATIGKLRMKTRTPSEEVTLANALSILANRLHERSDHTKALECIIEAETILESLLIKWPKAYKPDLAIVQLNKAIVLAAAGHTAAALLAARSATDAFRKLSGSHNRYLPQLAAALDIQAQALNHRGYSAEAADVQAEYSRILQAIRAPKQ